MSSATSGFFEIDESMEGKALPAGMSVELAHRCRDLARDLRAQGLTVVVAATDLRRVFSAFEGEPPYLSMLMHAVQASVARICTCPECTAQRAKAAAGKN